MAKRPHLHLVENNGSFDAEESRQHSRRTTRKGGRMQAAVPAGKMMARTSVAYSKTLKYKNANQALVGEAIDSSPFTFVIAPAGTGKTHIAVRKAVEFMLAGKVERIVFARPAVEAGERLGFLPGDAEAKVEPYMRPLYDELLSCVSPQQVKSWMADKKLEIAPIGFLRGRTLAKSFIVIDEAQNLTEVQLKMVVTRLGFGSTMVLTGDPDQIDPLPTGESGLMSMIDKLEGRASGVCVVRLGEADVVRHPAVRSIVEVLAA